MELPELCRMHQPRIPRRSVQGYTLLITGKHRDNDRVGSAADRRPISSRSHLRQSRWLDGEFRPTQFGPAIIPCSMPSAPSAEKHFWSRRV